MSLTSDRYGFKSHLVDNCDP